MAKRDEDPYRLMRFVAIAAGDGIAAGWTVLLALLWFDIGGLGALVHGAEDGPLALAIMLLSFAVTFGFVGLAWGIMVRLPDEE